MSIPIKRDYPKQGPQKLSTAGYFHETETRVWVCKSCGFRNSAKTMCIKCKRKK